MSSHAFFRNEVYRLHLALKEFNEKYQKELDYIQLVGIPPNSPIEYEMKMAIVTPFLIDNSPLFTSILVNLKDTVNNGDYSSQYDTYFDCVSIMVTYRDLELLVALRINDRKFPVVDANPDVVRACNSARSELYQIADHWLTLRNLINQQKGKTP